MNRSTILTVVGILLLVYAAAGNYVALPGYIRFLQRGGASASGAGFDISVLIGAVKTILWMYSFQLGVVALAVAHLWRQGRKAGLFAAGFGVWICLWSWPHLPAPGPWFYILCGSLLLVLIALSLSGGTRRTQSRLSDDAFLAAILFFAIATWEVCGLGSTGRMLHPAQAALPFAHNLLVTQSSKLMIEFVLAWGLLLASFRLRESGPAAAA